MRVAVVSLGCAKNLVDSETLLGLLQEAGHEIVGEPSRAEAIIVNTCSFVTEAKQESVNAILEVARYKGRECRILAVCGCLAEEYGAELAREIPEVDAIIGPGHLKRITTVLEKQEGSPPAVFVGPGSGMNGGTLPRVVSTGSGTAYLKIAEGCNHQCSFCLIPRLRGPYRSRPPESVLAEARSLIARGAGEIILVAQDTTYYGTDQPDYGRFADLLRRLARLEGLTWLRFLYGHPQHLRHEVLEVMAAEPGICHYLDLPFQHASPSVLRRMGRTGSGDEFLELVRRIRTALPGVTLRSTFIVGFPGETEADFRQLLQFLQAASLDWVGAFKFSPQEGTVAAGLEPAVPAEVAERRYHELMTCQQHISASRNRRWEGQTIPVLVEGAAGRKEQWIGRSRHQAPEVDGVVRFAGTGLHPGEIVPVRIETSDSYDLYGRVPKQALPGIS